MKDKKDNNLIKVTLSDGTIHYFTSTNRVAKYVNSVQSVIEYHMRRNNGEFKSIGAKFEIVDGSNVKYKDIN